jgi:hypothetical protein
MALPSREDIAADLLYLFVVGPGTGCGFRRNTG